VGIQALERLVILVLIWLLSNFILLLKHSLVVRELGTSSDVEELLLVAFVFGGGDAIHHEQFLVLLLELVEPLDLLLEIASQQFVRKGQLLNCCVLLSRLDVLVFVALHDALQLLDLLLKCGFIRSLCCQSLQTIVLLC
jgi:hypothetical protein